MKIIKNNDMLRRYMPNVLRPVAGEPTLLEKTLPMVADAEKWLEKELTGTPLTDKLAEGSESERLYMQSAQIIVYKAMTIAVPMLDLVLTPNGFGVVSNANVAPASRERVDKLISSLETEWQTVAVQLIDELRSEALWHDTPQFQRWSSLLMSPLELSQRIMDKLPLTSHVGYRSELAMLEREIENEFLGKEYMQKLRRDWWTDNVDIDDRKVIADVLTALALSLKAGKPRLDILLGTVDTIRNAPADHPVWHASRIADLYRHETFKNKKENHGYFF